MGKPRVPAKALVKDLGMNIPSLMEIVIPVANMAIQPENAEQIRQMPKPIRKGKANPRVRAKFIKLMSMTRLLAKTPRKLSEELFSVLTNQQSLR